ncbi:MAG: hypothetical protein ABI652_07190 [Acidobacteriota bacterium]
MHGLFTLLLRCSASVILATAVVVGIVDVLPVMRQFIAANGAFGVGLSLGGGLLAAAIFVYLAARIWDLR